MNIFRHTVRIKNASRAQISVGRALGWVTLSIIMVLNVGCASTNAIVPKNKHDPLEPINRVVFSFNENLDTYVLEPTAEVYRFVIPKFIRDRFSNMVSNIGDIYTSVNNLLQGKPKEAADDISRFFTNSTLGLAGMFDVASAAGLEKHKEDFGQTLGVWGVKPGPYIVLPIFGASNLRDTVGFYVDFRTDILFQEIPNIGVRNTVTGLRIIDVRAKYLDSKNLMSEAAFEKYTFVRDAYFSSRHNLIYDGNPPSINYDENLEDSEEPSSPVKPE